MNEGDIVAIKGEHEKGTAKVRRVIGSTVTLVDPLDGFRIWHADELDLIKAKENIQDDHKSDSADRS